MGRWGDGEMGELSVISEQLSVISYQELGKLGELRKMGELGKHLL